MRREAHKGLVTAQPAQEGHEIEAAVSPSGPCGRAECTGVRRNCPEGKAEQSWELVQDWLVCVYGRQSGKDLIKHWHQVEPEKGIL